MSPCHRFSPFRCTSFLRFVVFSPHSSLLASAVTAVVLRVLLLFFLCLALFVLLSVLFAVICARPLPFFCCFLACCCFSVPRPFCSTFRSSRCYLCAPFAFFSIAFCFIVQQTQNACYMFNSSTNGKDITKTCTVEIKAGDLVVKAWDNPPFHLYCAKRL